MLKFTIEHELDCSPDGHWELFFDPEWTESLIVGGLGFESCDVKPFVDEGDERSRQMRVIPKLDVPAAVAKLLGPRLGYTEKGVFHLPTKRWKYDLVLSVLAERIRLGGELTTKAIDGKPDKCTRVSELWVDCRIFGIGGMVERAAEKNMRDGWNKSADWINDWIAKNR